MSSKSRSALRGTLAVLVTVVGVSLAAGDLAAATPQKFQPSFDAALASLEAAGGGPGRLEIQRSQASGLVRSIVAGPGTSIRVSSASRGAAARDVALAFAAERAELFGLGSAMEVNVLSESGPDEVGLQRVRMQQVVNGVPVTGSFLSVHVKDGAVVRAFAGTSALASQVQTTANVPEQSASSSARKLVEKYFKAQDAELSKPRLEILDRDLLEGKRGRKPQLAWFVEARKIDLREFIWVDAKSGDVLLHFSQLTTARSRKVYDAASGNVLPGTLKRSEGGAAIGDADVDTAYQFSGDTYDYFFTQHGRDSFDGTGGQMISTIRYCPDVANCPYANAFWNGTQMVYGAGYSVADDVDGHELTHAVTERSAGLFYYYQSGALNESFSDIFGETIDLLNGAGDDTGAARWYMGEDVPGSGGVYRGALRNMMFPNLFQNPGRMNDQYYWCNSQDQGGVHINSGLQNHAYALMVDGGTFNGFTVTGFGLTKAGKIAYRTLTQYLESGSNFADAYAGWNSSCSDLVGTAGITASDCTQVRNALNAVELNAAIACPDGVAVPQMCTQGQVPNILWSDGLEGGSGNWTIDTMSGASQWFAESGYASEGDKMLFAYGIHPSTHVEITGDSAVRMVPGVVLPAGAFMQFDHSFDLESGYDGGWVEYSLNGGAWTVATPSTGFLYDFPSLGDPFGLGDPITVAHPVFSGFSWGYTASQFNLAAFAGQSIRFRFRNWTDAFVGQFGWAVDNVRIYTCVAPSSDPPTGVVATGSASSVSVSWNAASGATSYQVWRKAPGGSFVMIGTTAATSFPDNTVVGGTAYLYGVKAVRPSGTSALSAKDVALAMTFTDPSLTAGTAIKLAHLSELRTAVDAVRALAGLGLGTYVDAAAPGLLVRETQVLELRTQLDAALSAPAIGIAATPYTDAALTGIGVKAAHYQELRARMQ